MPALRDELDGGDVLTRKRGIDNPKVAGSIAARPIGTAVRFSSWSKLACRRLLKSAVEILVDNGDIAIVSRPERLGDASSLGTSVSAGALAWRKLRSRRRPAPAAERLPPASRISCVSAMTSRNDVTVIDS